MSLYCGIDLLSNNRVLVVIDEEDNKVVDKPIDNNLNVTFELLTPYQEQIKAVAIEPNGGYKYSGDHQDAFHFAHLMRQGILPTGYIYPPEYRQLRGLLRGRRQRVKHASSHMISIQKQIWRSLGYGVNSVDIRKKTFTLPLNLAAFYIIQPIVILPCSRR